MGNSRGLLSFVVWAMPRTVHRVDEDEQLWQKKHRPAATRLGRCDTDWQASMGNKSSNPHPGGGLHSTCLGSIGVRTRRTTWGACHLHHNVVLFL